MCKSHTQTESSPPAASKNAAGRVLENPYERVSPYDITFGTVQEVIDSWQMVLAIPDWNAKTGEVGMKRLFEIAPEVKVAWGFPEDFDPKNIEDENQNKFKLKGLGFMKGLDKAVAYLGPDLEPLEEELVELGRQHVHMDAQPEFFPPVGVAVIGTLQEILGDKFTEEMKQSWLTVYTFLAYFMVEGLIAERTGK